MAWYDETVFYHIYPLGLLGAPAQNPYEEPVHRLQNLKPWIRHIHDLGFTGLYIGPLFESVGHGYETTDYYRLDSRLGTNEDLKELVRLCHENQIRVILDGVFNHTGRDFFAFKDLQANRENSPYRDWYCNVNFWGNNEYNDGFSYENWGGYNLLVRLNQRNPQVVEYICSVIRYWVREFDIDGLRLDAADVLDFDFMRTLRRLAGEVKEDFWLMGEVIHGEYSRWVNADMLHSVTDYALHKALYSGHNDHNYFEIAHTVNRTGGMLPGGARLYNFVDNHDVERIASKLQDGRQYLPVHVLLFTLPGIPSVYYGSEFAIEGRKEWGSDASLRPYLDPSMCEDAAERDPHVRLIGKLASLRAQYKDLVWGEYRQLHLTTGQYAFARGSLLIAVNNEDREVTFSVPAAAGAYTGVLGEKLWRTSDGQLTITLPGISGEVFVPAPTAVDEVQAEAERAAEAKNDEAKNNEAKNDEAKNDEVQAEAELAAEVKNTEAQAEAEPAAEVKNTEAQAEEEQVKETQAEKSLVEELHLAERPAEDTRMTKDHVRVEVPEGLSFEQMNVEQLQSYILSRMEANGPVTDRMQRDVMENVWHDSLVNWAKSFR